MLLTILFFQDILAINTINTGFCKRLLVTKWQTKQHHFI